LRDQLSAIFHVIKADSTIAIVIPGGIAGSFQALRQVVRQSSVEFFLTDKNLMHRPAAPQPYE